VPTRASVSTAGELLAPDSGNSANYNPSGFQQGVHFAFVDGNALVNSASHYGTFNQAGNVHELCDTILDTGRVIRGGSSSFGAVNFDSTVNNRGTGMAPTRAVWDWGFRITSLRSFE
jgi:hypothetical protein